MAVLIAGATRPSPLLPDVEAAVRGLHAEGVAATARGRQADASRRLLAGLAMLGWSERSPAGQPADPGRDALAARLLISLAYAEAEQGRTRYGFDLLDEA